MKFEVTLTKGKETSGTWVYTGPKTNAEGKPNATTSIYLSKELVGATPPATVKVTIEA